MMTKNDIREFMGQLNIGPWDGSVIFDRQYKLPDRDWFFGEFAESLAKNIQALGMVYEEEADDCDNFGVLTYILGQLSHFHRKSNHATFIFFNPRFDLVRMFNYEHESNS